MFLEPSSMTRFDRAVFPQQRDHVVAPRSLERCVSVLVPTVHIGAMRQ